MTKMAVRLEECVDTWDTVNVDRMNDGIGSPSFPDTKSIATTSLAQVVTLTQDDSFESNKRTHTHTCTHSLYALTLNCLSVHPAPRPIC